MRYFLFILFFLTPFITFADVIHQDFPDAIICNTDITYWGYDSQVTLFHAFVDNDNWWGSGANTVLYVGPDPITSNVVVIYNSDGTFNSLFGGAVDVLTDSDCDGIGVSDLYLTGQAIDFGSFASSSGSGATYVTNYNAISTSTALDIQNFSKWISLLSLSFFVLMLFIVLCGGVIYVLWISRA